MVVFSERQFANSEPTLLIMIRPGFFGQEEGQSFDPSRTFSSWDELLFLGHYPAHCITSGVMAQTLSAMDEFLREGLDLLYRSLVPVE